MALIISWDRYIGSYHASELCAWMNILINAHLYFYEARGTLPEVVICTPTFEVAVQGRGNNMCGRRMAEINDRAFGN